MIEELIVFLAAAFVVLLIFISGLLIGWTQREKDKKRDASHLAEAILRSCEKKAKAEVIKFKANSN